MSGRVVPRYQGGVVDAEDHAEGIEVAFLLAFLAGPARHDGRVVDEARSQVAQRSGRVVGRERSLAEAIDLFLNDAENA